MKNLILKSSQHQQGATLVTSLVILLVITLLGLTGMQTTTLEEKMAGNSHNGNLAFQAAESALRESEILLANLTAEPVANSTGSNGIWLLDSPDSDTANDSKWWDDNNESWWSSYANIYSSSLDSVKTLPTFVIEENGFIRDSLNMGQQQYPAGRNFYRVTARGTGGTDTARIILQSTFTRRF